MLFFLEEEKKRKLEGDLNKDERLLAKKQALTVSVPTQEEIQMIHQFFISDSAQESQVCLLLLFVLFGSALFLNVN